VRAGDGALPAGSRFALRIAGIAPPSAAAPEPERSPGAPPQDAAAGSAAGPSPARGASLTVPPEAASLSGAAAPPEGAPGRRAPAGPAVTPAAQPSDAPDAVPPAAASPPRARLAGTSEASGEEIVARVVRQAPTGVVLDSALGVLSVDGLDAPEAALVRFVLVAPASGSRPKPAARQSWSALGEALRILEPTAPNLAERLAADLQPKNPEGLSATVRLLAAAQRAEAPPALTAEFRETLQALGRTELVDDVQREFALPRHAAATQQPGWHIIAFPIHDGASLRPAQLRIDEETARNRGERDRASRFVLEVGALQFDGLIRKRRLDLLLRSSAPLRDEMRAEIERIFRAAIDASGWSGDIAFSTTPAFPAAGEALCLSA
jgi:hypothetical protein